MDFWLVITNIIKTRAMLLIKNAFRTITASGLSSTHVAKTDSTSALVVKTMINQRYINEKISKALFES